MVFWRMIFHPQNDGTYTLENQTWNINNGGLENDVLRCKIGDF